MNERANDLRRALVKLVNAANPDRVRRGLSPARMRMLERAWEDAAALVRATDRSTEGTA